MLNLGIVTITFGYFFGVTIHSSLICLGHEFTKCQENIMAALYGTIRGPIPIEAYHLWGACRSVLAKVRAHHLQDEV